MCTTRLVGILAFVAACTSFDPVPAPAPDGGAPPAADAAAPPPDAGAPPLDAGEDAGPLCFYEERPQTAGITITPDPDPVPAGEAFAVTVVVDAAEPSTHVVILVCSKALGAELTFGGVKVERATRPFQFRYQIAGLPKGETLLRFRADPNDSTIWATRSLTIK